MRIRLLSDIHLEFFIGGDAGRFIDELAWQERKAPSDVLVLAGDVSSHDKIEAHLKLFSQRFKRVVYVAGNHELYGSSPMKLCDTKLSFDLPENLSWLECNSTTIDGVRFLGATLWFDNPHSDYYKHAMNDFQIIEGFEPWVYERNRLAKAFFETAKPGDVVVSHHLPSNLSVHAKYFNNPLNRFFVSPIDDLIKRCRPRLWLHGHTHESCDYNIVKTRVVCNPYGYEHHEVNPQWQSNLVIEI